MILTEQQILNWVAAFIWPFFRIGALGAVLTQKQANYAPTNAYG